jgi:hypothetical protein
MAMDDKEAPLYPIVLQAVICDLSYLAMCLFLRPSRVGKNLNKRSK